MTHTAIDSVKALDWLAWFRLFSRERLAVASKTELRRWFDAGNVQMNGERVEWGEPMDFPLISVVIFPNGKRITLL
jgi:hypothetical protein